MFIGICAKTAQPHLRAFGIPTKGQWHLFGYLQSEQCFEVRMQIRSQAVYSGCPRWIRLHVAEKFYVSHANQIDIQNIHLSSYDFPFFIRIPVDLTPVVYCSVVEHGSDAEWNFLWNKYKSSNTASEKEVILKALGCTKQTNLLKVNKRTKRHISNAPLYKFLIKSYNLSSLSLRVARTSEIFRSDFVRWNSITR